MLADSAYVGEDGLITKWKRKKDSVLSDHKKKHNATIDLYRARVEHIMHEVKRHAVFQRPFRGSRKLLATYIKFAANIHNIRCRCNPRYSGFGNYDHVFN